MTILIHSDFKLWQWWADNSVSSVIFNFVLQGILNTIKKYIQSVSCCSLYNLCHGFRWSININSTCPGVAQHQFPFMQVYRPLHLCASLRTSCFPNLLQRMMFPHEIPKSCDKPFDFLPVSTRVWHPMILLPKLGIKSRLKCLIPITFGM